MQNTLSIPEGNSFALLKLLSVPKVRTEGQPDKEDQHEHKCPIFDAQYTKAQNTQNKKCVTKRSG